MQIWVKSKKLSNLWKRKQFGQNIGAKQFENNLGVELHRSFTEGAHLKRQ